MAEAANAAPLVPAAQPLIGDEERAAVDRVLQSGGLAQGPEVAAFEREFSAALAGGRHCSAVNSGTSALHLGLLALGVGPGDEVVVPSFTFAATANAVALTGATPVFADIDERTYTLDAASVSAVLSPRTVGILPVHLYGHPAAMPELCDLAASKALFLFEDAAQAHGASLDGRPVGTFGSGAAYSFYPTKNMTSGEGGMVVTAEESVDRLVRLLRNQGMERRYQNEVVGFNCRMTDVHAAIGRVQLRGLAERTRQRQRNAARLDAELRGVSIPYVADGAEHVYHQYTIRIRNDRDGFAEALRHEHAVGSGVYYPVPVHALPSFGLSLDLPGTQAAAAEVLSLPVHPALSEGQLNRVIEAVNAVAAAGS